VGKQVDFNLELGTGDGAGTQSKIMVPFLIVTKLDGYGGSGSGSGFAVSFRGGEEILKKKEKGQRIENRK
jgi:hypothetical protein